jgi:hypothetical protein
MVNGAKLMSATLIGTTATWGITNDETGILVESLDLDYQTKEKEQLNKQGEVQGLSLYGETVACALKGEVPTASAFSGKTAGTLSLANSIAAHSQATLTSARNVIKNIKRGIAREDFSKFDIGSVIYPLIAAS